MSPLKGPTTRQYAANRRRLASSPHRTRVSVETSVPWGCGSRRKFQTALAKPAPTGCLKSSSVDRFTPPASRQNRPSRPRTISRGGSSESRVNPMPSRVRVLGSGGDAARRPAIEAGSARNPIKIRTGRGREKSRRLSASKTASCDAGTTAEYRAATCGSDSQRSRAVTRFAPGHSFKKLHSGEKGTRLIRTARSFSTTRRSLGLIPMPRRAS